MTTRTTFSAALGGLALLFSGVSAFAQVDSGEPTAEPSPTEEGAEDTAAEEAAEEEAVSAEDRDRALALGRRALELYNRGRWVDAYERFAQADALVHSPVFRLYMARAKRHLGELLAAESLYHQIETSSLATDAPEPWRDAQRDARVELAALRDELPRVTFVLEGVPKGFSVRLTLDGRPFEPRGPRSIDPGEHAVTALCGEQTSRQRFFIDRGQERRIEVTVSCAKIPTPEEAPPEGPGPLGGGDETQRHVGIGLFAAGAALGVVALVTGPLAVAEADDLSALCNADLECPPDQAAKLDTYYALAHTTTTTLVVGGAALVTGLVVWLTAPESSVTATANGLSLRF